MEQAKVPVFKSRPMKPFLYSHLATSTPDSHQISKRIKGLLAYSEHYKGNRVDSPNVGPKFSPLRTRDYRKARELTLEIWDPMIQASFLEKFLKSQTNLHTIRVLTKQKHKEELLERLCEILSKIGRLNRVQIDFKKDQMVKQAKPLKIQGIESMRLLPKLKDLDVTVNGKQLLPFSVSLTKVGFGSWEPLKMNVLEKFMPPFSVSLTKVGFGGWEPLKVNVLEKFMKKVPKFQNLDTIKIDCTFPCALLDGLLLVISKLPNFRELDFNFSQGLELSLETNLKILDMLAKAPKFEILKLGFISHGRSQISLLKHPLFKAKSLKRTSLSLHFSKDLSTPAALRHIFDLLGKMPSLYELSVNFCFYFMITDEVAENQMEKISRMASIRKLKMAFDHSITLSEKQAGNILKSILKMHFLEELDLKLPQHFLRLNGGKIEGLPRLKKACLNFQRSKEDCESGEVANDMLKIVEMLGKCPQLRELEFKVLYGVSDFQTMAVKLCESLRKLKRLEIIKCLVSPRNETSMMTMDALEDLVSTCHQLRNLQDFSFQMGGLNFIAENATKYNHLLGQLKSNKKYRILFEFMPNF